MVARVREVEGPDPVGLEAALRTLGFHLSEMESHQRVSRDRICLESFLDGGFLGAEENKL